MKALSGGPKVGKFVSSIKENYISFCLCRVRLKTKGELTWEVNYLILSLNKNPRNIGLNTFLVTIFKDTKLILSKVKNQI